MMPSPKSQVLVIPKYETWFAESIKKTDKRSKNRTGSFRSVSYRIVNRIVRELSYGGKLEQTKNYLGTLP